MVKNEHDSVCQIWLVKMTHVHLNEKSKKCAIRRKDAILLLTIRFRMSRKVKNW